MGYNGSKNGKGHNMVNLEHDNTSIRLLNRDGESVKTIRTFSGVRNDMTASQVNTLITGVSIMVAVPANGATMTTRAVMVKA